MPLIQVQDGTLASIAAWYDNEMGYSTRLAETEPVLYVDPVGLQHIVAAEGKAPAEQETDMRQPPPGRRWM